MSKADTAETKRQVNGHNMTPSAPPKPSVALQAWAGHE